MAQVGQWLPLNASDNFKWFCASLPVCSIRFLADALKKEFMRLYKEYLTAADKYLKFQVKWHQHCSYYLIEYNHELSLVGLHLSDPIAVDVVHVAVWLQWLCVVIKYSLTRDDTNNYLVAVFMMNCCVLVIHPLMLVSLLHSHGLKTV